MVFLKEFFEKVNFEKNQQTTKKHEQFPRWQRLNSACWVILHDFMLSADFFFSLKINVFEKKFQEYHQCVEQLTSRSGVLSALILV